MVYLIDASFFVFRAYHSMPAHMADRDGRPVHAVYGFARFLSDLLERARPEYVGVAFDESLTSSFRNRLYPPYKANRELPPAELKEQFTRCRDLCRRTPTPASHPGHRDARIVQCVGETGSPAGGLFRLGWKFRLQIGGFLQRPLPHVLRSRLGAGNLEVRGSQVPAHPR